MKTTKRRFIYGLLMLMGGFILCPAPRAAEPVTGGLVLWLDARDADGDGQSDDSPDGAGLALWADKSGSGNDAVASGPLTIASSGLHGQPAVAFDGSSFFRTATGGEGLHEGFTMFAVFENDGLAEVDFAVMWGNEAEGQRRGMLKHALLNGVFGFNGYYADVNSGTAVVPNEPYLGAITKAPGLDGVIRVYLNGPQLASGIVPLVDYTSAAITVGANNDPNNSEQWNGHIAEVLVYGRELSGQELNQTGNYLKFKYGLNATYTDLGWVQQPRSQATVVGAEAVLTAEAVGQDPISYQWYRDGLEMPGGAERTLNLASVELSDAGEYFAVASNPAGSVTSVVAFLDVVTSAPQAPIPGDLVLWLDAADVDGDGQPDGTATGELVTLWVDKSGSGNDATAVGTLTYDLGGLNGQAAVRFDGSSFFQTASGGESLHDVFTMFVVFANDGNSDYDSALMWGNESPGQRRGMLKYNSGVFTFNGYAADVNSATQVVPGQGAIGAITKETGLTALIRVYLDGTQVASGVRTLTDFTSAAINIGANSGGGEQWNGDIAEVLVYGRDLTPAELNETGLYLQHKYGIASAYQLPPSLSIIPAGAGVTLSWLRDASWRLECADELPAAAWTEVPGVVGNRVTVEPSSAARFYRLRYQP